MRILFATGCKALRRRPRESGFLNKGNRSGLFRPGSQDESKKVAGNLERVSKDGDASRRPLRRALRATSPVSRGRMKSPPPRSGGGGPCEAWWRGLPYPPAQSVQPRGISRQSFSQRTPYPSARILLSSLRHEGAVPDRPTLRRGERRLRALVANGHEAPGIEGRARALRPLLPAFGLALPSIGRGQDEAGVKDAPTTPPSAILRKRRAEAPRQGLQPAYKTKPQWRSHRGASASPHQEGKTDAKPGRKAPRRG
jgi:hypothetical protein